MRINESIFNSRYKISFVINNLENNIPIVSHLEFTLKYLIIKVHSKKKNKEVIDQFIEMLSPIHYENDRDYIVYINYSFIDKFNRDEKNFISMVLINPLFKRKIILVINSIEKCNLIFSSKLKNDQIISLIKMIDCLKENEKSTMHENIFHFTKNLLEIANSKSSVSIIDNKLLVNSFFEGKKYYEKSVKELIKKDRVKSDIHKKILVKNKDFKMMKNIINLNQDGEEYEYANYETLLSNIFERFTENLIEFLELFFNINLLDNNFLNYEKANKIEFDNFNEIFILDKKKNIQNEEKILLIN